MICYVARRFGRFDHVRPQWNVSYHELSPQLASLCHGRATLNTLSFNLDLDFFDRSCELAHSRRLS